MSARLDELSVFLQKTYIKFSVMFIQQQQQKFWLVVGRDFLEIGIVGSAQNNYECTSTKNFLEKR